MIAAQPDSLRTIWLSRASASDSPVSNIVVTTSRRRSSHSFARITWSRRSRQPLHDLARCAWPQLGVPQHRVDHVPHRQHDLAHAGHLPAQLVGLPLHVGARARLLVEQPVLDLLDPVVELLHGCRGGRRRSRRAARRAAAAAELEHLRVVVPGLDHRVDVEVRRRCTVTSACGSTNAETLAGRSCRSGGSVIAYVVDEQVGRIAVDLGSLVRTRARPRRRAGPGRARPRSARRSSRSGRQRSAQTTRVRLLQVVGDALHREVLGLEDSLPPHPRPLPSRSTGSSSAGRRCRCAAPRRSRPARSARPGWCGWRG